MSRPFARLLLLLWGAPLLVACGGARPATPRRAPVAQVMANDNQTPAGRWRGRALTLELEIGEADWRWERQLAPYRVRAFGERGRALTTPGPLIRVPEGTVVDVTIHSRLDADIQVHGLGDRAVATAPLRVPARGSARARFRATAAGTFYYWGSAGGPLTQRMPEDSQLTGALVVDPPGRRPTDRVFVIGNRAQRSASELPAWVINGRSWPDTERFTIDVGEQVTWRWINATDSPHPMHLHGTYFHVTAMGDNARDVRLAGDRRPFVVTQVVQPGATMAMVWSPARPGNWLFHCHNLGHVMPDNRLPFFRMLDDYAPLPHDQHMSGLVLGIRARARPAKPDRPGRGVAPRRLTLHVGARRGVRYSIPGLASPGLGYALGEGPVTAPGPTLVLERGRPVEIEIVNHIQRDTTVHWHGIELDSYYDGVPHFGGEGRHLTPLIRPGGRFVARFTPPRAGTFIYHSHFNDYVQLSSGLYGALIVVEPGERLDPEVDHVFVISRGGLDDEKDPVLLNGAVEPPATRLGAGRRHRLRIIGMTPLPSAQVRLLRGGRPVRWRALAKDGAALPPARAAAGPAEVEVHPGETYDFEVVAARPGELRLEAVLQRRAGQRASARLVIARPAGEHVVPARGDGLLGARGSR